MLSPSDEGLITLQPLLKRCATSFSLCDLVAGRRFSRDSYNTQIIEPFHLGLNPNAPSTEVDDSYIEAKEPELQLLVTPATNNVHTALFSNQSGSSNGTPHGQDPLKPTRTTRRSTRRFERPNYLHIFTHAVFCCAAYPIVYTGTVAAKDRSLFWARVIVGLWCAGVGVVIGWSLVAFAMKYMEAASKPISRVFFSPVGVRLGAYRLLKAWATVIHLSHGENGSGIKLKDLAHNTHQTGGAMSGFRLLWTRFSNRGADRRARRAIEWDFPSLC